MAEIKQTPKEKEEKDKMTWGGSVDIELYNVLEQLRAEEERPLSNMIVRLLKTHPRVEPLLKAEVQGVAA
jgi:hypothetical protein